MKDISEILNQIGDFSFQIEDKTIVSTGLLLEDRGEVVFKCSVEIELYRKIAQLDTFEIVGNINNLPIKMLNAYQTNATHQSGQMFCNVVFKPSEIIIGRNCFEEIQVTQISMTTAALNYMFSTSPLSSKHFTKENPAVLEFTSPESLKANDTSGELNIYQSFGGCWSRNSINYDIVTVIEYRFFNPMSVSKALSKIAAVRNLFSFFANHYIPFGKVEFSDLNSYEIEDHTLCDCTLYLNHDESIPVSDEPFLIATSRFANHFQNIWDKWIELYENLSPIPNLFYEIICNRSTRINRFLNLVQAIEVYSSNCRDKMAAFISEERKTGPNYVILEDRLKEILAFLKKSLNLSEEDVSEVAHALANMRNYYTHYSKRKKEPSYHEVFAAGHVLELVLLAIVYSALGLSEETIADCKCQGRFQRFDEFIKMLKDYNKS